MLQALREAAFGKQTLLRQIPDVVFERDFETPRFTLNLARKTCAWGRELAEEAGAPMELAAMRSRVQEEGVRRGWGDWDNLSTFMLAEERAGVEMRT